MASAALPRSIAGMNAALPRLGLDIGGVLVDRAFHDTPTSFFGDRPLDTPPVAGWQDLLPDLVQSTFEHRVVLISKAGRRIAHRTRQWLEHLTFHERTGVARHHVYFVTKRSEKAALCEQLGVTHFVDDRSEVLDSLLSVQHRFLFTGGLGSAPPDEPGQGVQVAADWPSLVRLLSQARDPSLPGP